MVRWIQHAVSAVLISLCIVELASDPLLLLVRVNPRFYDLLQGSDLWHPWVPTVVLSVCCCGWPNSEYVKGFAGQSDPCFTPATAATAVTGVTNLKLPYLSQVACQNACTNALTTYDMVCFSFAYNGQTRECLLSGNESTLISHTLRLPSAAMLTSPATAVYNNICNKGQTCVDLKRNCAYNGQPVCKQYAPWYNKNTTATGVPCKLWNNDGTPLVGNNYKTCASIDGNPGPWCWIDVAPWRSSCYPDCDDSAAPVCPITAPNSNLKIIKQRTWVDGQVADGAPFPEDFTNPFNITVTIAGQQGSLYTLNVSNWSPRALTELRCRVYFKNNATTPADLTIPGPIQDWTIYSYQSALSGVTMPGDVKEIRVLFPFPWYSINFFGYGRRNPSEDDYQLVNAGQKRVYSRLISDLRILFHLPTYRLWLLGYRMNQSDSVRHGRQSDFDRKADSFLVTLGEVKTGSAGSGAASRAFGLDTRPSRAWSGLHAFITSGSLEVYLKGWLKDPYWTLEHEMQHNHNWKDREFEMQSTQYMMRELSARAFSSCILQWFKAPLERYEDTALLSAFQDPKDGLIYVLSAYTYRTIDLKNFIVPNSPPGAVQACAPPGMDCYQKTRPDCLNPQAYTANKKVTLSGRACQDGSCHIYNGDNQPWCYGKDDQGVWQPENCYNDCGAFPVDAEDPLYCVKADKTCAYKNVPICNGRIPGWAISLPDCDDLSRSMCVDETKGCVMEFSERCNEEIWGYKGPRFTSAEGMPCFSGPENGYNCYGDHAVNPGDYNQSSPFCFLQNSDGERDMCFKICESPMLQNFRAKRRAFIQQRWSDVWEPMKFSFRTASGGLFYVSYSYGAAVADETVRKYDGSTGQYVSEQSLSWFLYYVDRYYNPQFLQGFGGFIGSQYCELDEVNEYLNGCENVFVSKQWADLRKFSGDTGDFDLVFRSDNYGFFFKGSEYIVYDLTQMKALPYYPKLTKDFLYKIGIFGRTVAALV